MKKEDQISPKKALSDEVLRKIGRNVVLFQMIEGLLKFLVFHHHFEGTATDIVDWRKERAEEVKVKTMGTLKQDYINDILSDAGLPQKEAEGVTEPSWMSLTFKSTIDSEKYKSLSDDLKLMVDERNDLIHNFLPRWQPESLERLAAATSYLDQQHEKVLPMFDHLKFAAKSLETTKQAMGEFLASDEGKRQFELMWLQHSPLVTLLRDVTSQKVRSDGWTYLSDAGQLARIHESDAVARIKELYGHSTLKQLLIASELFDLLDEHTSNGNFRTLYRVKQMS